MKDQDANVISSRVNEGDESWLVYSRKSSAFSQVLRLRFKDENTIAFEADISGECERRIAGVAISQGGDFEIDEDEQGVAYPSEEFHYDKGECHISVRVEAHDRSMVRMKEVGCASACLFGGDLMVRNQ